MKTILWSLLIAMFMQKASFAAEFTLIGEGGDSESHVTRAYHISDDTTYADIKVHMAEMKDYRDTHTQTPGEIYGWIIDVVYFKEGCSEKGCLSELNRADSDTKVIDFLSDYLSKTPASFNGLYRWGKENNILDCSKPENAYYWCI
ncbi:hypothetical protein F9L33_11135 [Amylibacter sp. SFDW26]|uniref:hypothetical protein n=1 Tax=Amylibacter sp. SFDW26 TaxID=2652722 RepID=UPI00126290E4|nr:hypothetical protein [Amylibacter sp. SFDW26]KAB7613906.1 hypothetical protein F9L33_11135 [Amylibacter sp. SFDW26]